MERVTAILGVILIGIVGFLTLPMSSCTDRKADVSTKTDSLAKAKPLTDLPPASTAADSLANGESELEKLRRLIKNMNDTNLDEQFDPKEYSEHPNAALGQLNAFVFAAGLIQDADKSPDQEIVRMGKQLRKKIMAQQRKELPKLRQAYAKALHNIVISDNVECWLSNDNTAQINFFSPSFKDRQKSKNFQDGILEELQHLRFKRANYFWRKGQTDYAYYHVNSPDDSELYIEEFEEEVEEAKEEEK